ncbi:MAG: DUF4105 domain-containing protein [Lewinellaceae bacterium]|nr:DUF4105 domain-containing protein [Lewinellaceae bacterium]
MNLRTLLALTFLLGGSALSAQQQLSENARLSLMTVAPGDMLYSTFGHSALRVYDPALRLDRCYNYGTFNFDEPNFLLKFCQGRLRYYLNVEPYRAFEYGNLHDRRPMREQLLNLTPEKRQRLFELLEENAREENKYYMYDFFYDNCATRIRDIVKEAFFHQINFDSSGLAMGTTMRHLLRPYLANMPWTQFGIDLALGQPADRVALAEDFMFLPDYVHDLFGAANINDSMRLVASESNIPFLPLPARQIYKPGFFGNPLWVMCLVAVIGLLCMANPRAERIFDTVFWFVLGFAGLVLFLLWAATDHSTTKFNWNILWAMPTHLLFFWRNKRTEWTENYFMVSGSMALLVLIFWGFLPQDLPEAALPIVILIVLKAFFHRYRRDSTSGF